jgi:ribonuclease Z
VRAKSIKLKNMKLTFLGTNGWYSTKTGNTVCTLVESKKYNIVFDAGDSIYKLGKYLNIDKPTFLFLSHLHVDHIIGFHSISLLNRIDYEKDIHIFVPKGAKKILGMVINHPIAVPFDACKAKVTITELNEGIHRLPFSVQCLKLYHIDKDFGYRIKIDGKIITYCSDTGICENGEKLSRNANILIHECSNKVGKQSGKWGHSDPMETAQLAKRCKVKKLFLTHFDSTQYLSLKDRKDAEKSARKVFKNTWTARDGKVIKI